MTTHDIYGDTMLNIIIRTVLMYAVVVVAVRVMGKRQVSDMQSSELVVTLMISQVAALPLENPGRPLLTGLVPILVLAGVEILLSLIMLKSRKARGIICGHPIVVIKDGQLVKEELNRLRISREDIYSLLRQQNYSDESGIRWAIIEPNGSLSVLEDKDVSGDGISSAELKDELDSLRQNKSKNKNKGSS